MNIFFFGNTSFAAQYLSKELSKKNKITFFSRQNRRNKEFVYFDLKNKNHKILKKNSMRKIDYLFFFSSYVPKNETKANFKSCMNTNVYGLINLLKNNKFKVKKIILSSSCSIYGEDRNIKYDETVYLKPQNWYSISKFLQEKILQVYCYQNNIEFLAYRIGYVFGNNMNNARLVKKIYLNHKKKKKVKLFNKNLNLNLIHTKDISHLIQKTFKQAKGIYNLTYPFKSLLGDFYRILKNKKTNYKKYKNNYSSKKLKNDFFTPKFDLNKSIQLFKDEN